MDEREFIDGLWSRYADTYERPIQTMRRVWYDFPIGSEKWIELARRGARLEWDYGELLARGLVQYPKMERWLTVKFAKQCYDEYKHYALIADFLKSLGNEITDPYEIPATPIRSYYDRLLSSNIDFILFGTTEKIADNAYREYHDRTDNEKWKEIIRILNRDESFHLSFLNERLRGMSKTDQGRVLVEKCFVESWSESLRGNIISASKLGVDVASILRGYPLAAKQVTARWPDLAASIGLAQTLQDV